jgi:transcriptional regulator with XRE-family HTH domain
MAAARTGEATALTGPAVAGPGGGEHRARPLLRTALGGVLRKIRQAEGRTLGDVARAARVSVPYLSELERGRKEASSEVLAAICVALRVELADVLADAGRQLAGDRARVFQVVRLHAVDGGAAGGGAQPAAGRPGEAQALLAA